MKAYLAEQQQSYQKQIEIRQQVISETETPAASTEATAGATAPIPEPAQPEDQAEDLSPNKQTRALRSPRTSASESSPSRRSLRSVSTADPPAAQEAVPQEQAEQNMPAAEPATSAPPADSCLPTDRSADSDETPSALNENETDRHQDKDDGVPLAVGQVIAAKGETSPQPAKTTETISTPKEAEPAATNITPDAPQETETLVSAATADPVDEVAASEPDAAVAEPEPVDEPVDQSVTAPEPEPAAEKGAEPVAPQVPEPKPVLEHLAENVAEPEHATEKVTAVPVSTSSDSALVVESTPEQVKCQETAAVPAAEANESLVTEPESSVVEGEGGTQSTSQLDVPQPPDASTEKSSESPVKSSDSSPKKSERKERHDSPRRSRGEEGEKRSTPRDRVSDRRRLIMDKKEEVGDEAKAKPKRKWGSGSERQISRGISSSQLNSLLPKTEKVSVGSQEESQTGDAAAENITMSGKFSRAANGSLGSTQRLPADQPDPAEAPVEQKPVNGQSGIGEVVPVSDEVAAARNPVSHVLFVENLTRPFTLPALHSLLKSFGSIDTGKFWIDKIKSMCLVAYASAEEAEAARKGLCGTRWPSSNPKTLVADFSTEEEIVQRKAEAEKPVVQPAAPVRPASDKYDITIRKTFADEKDASDKPVRDWDRDKLSTPPPSKRSRRSPSPVQRADDKQCEPYSFSQKTVLTLISVSSGSKMSPEPECPAKLLDDLFKKTASSPIIYWLPLNEEEAEQRIKVREEGRERRRQQQKVDQETVRPDRRSPPPPPRMVRSRPLL